MRYISSTIFVIMFLAATSAYGAAKIINVDTIANSQCKSLAKNISTKLGKKITAPKLATDTIDMKKTDNDIDYNMHGEGCAISFTIKNPKDGVDMMQFIPDIIDKGSFGGGDWTSGSSNGVTGRNMMCLITSDQSNCGGGKAEKNCVEYDDDSWPNKPIKYKMLCFKTPEIFKPEKK